MSLGGIITGALGGAAKGYTEVATGELKKSQELDLKKQLMDAEEQKLLRIDEIKRNRDTADIGKNAEATAAAAPIIAKGQAAAAPILAQGQADSAPIIAQGTANAAPILAQGEANAAPIKGRGEAAGLIAKNSTPGYLASVTAETGAKETSGSKATAAVANFELGQKKALADLRKTLSSTSDPNQRALLDQQIRDISGGSTKSYADMVTAGDAFRKLANGLREQLKDDLSLTDGEKEDIKSRIRLYEDQAGSVLNSTVGKRLGDTGKKPAAPAPASAPGAPGAPGATRPTLGSFYK